MAEEGWRLGKARRADLRDLDGQGRCRDSFADVWCVGGGVGDGRADGPGADGRGADRDGGGGGDCAGEPCACAGGVGTESFGFSPGGGWGAPPEKRIYSEITCALASFPRTRARRIAVPRSLRRQWRIDGGTTPHQVLATR